MTIIDISAHFEVSNLQYLFWKKSKPEIDKKLSLAISEKMIDIVEQYSIYKTEAQVKHKIWGRIELRVREHLKEYEF